MASVRRVLMEVKRRLGAASSAVPGETDLLAGLNNALGEMWRRGVEMKSPLLCTRNTVTYTDGALTTDDGVAMVLWLRCVDTGLPVVPAFPASSVVADASGDHALYYARSPEGVVLFPSPPVGTRYELCYIPEFSPVGRDGNTPFGAVLDVPTVQWVLAVVEGKSPPADALFALSRYYRGGTTALPTGNPPW